MGSVRTRIKAVLPPPIVQRLVWLKRAVAPSDEHRRADRFLRLCGDPRSVMQGPFRGLELRQYARGSIKPFYLLGTYEKDLWPFVERMIAWGPDLLVDIGSADGYYAVGFARRLPQLKGIAYEADPFYRHLTRRTASINRCGKRVTTRGFCDGESLRTELEASRRPAVFCDCEGYEATLLDPEVVSSQRRAAMLVELHEGKVPDLVDLLYARFGSTHHIEVVSQQDRIMADLPEGVHIGQDQALAMMRNTRKDSGRWMLLTPVSVEGAEHNA